MALEGIQNSGLASMMQKPADKSAGTGNGSVDKDGFLKLLIAQLKAQDPLSPADSTQFVQQLATFSQLEQSIAQTKGLDTLSMQLTGIAANDAVGLIGKEVTVHGKYINFDGANPTGFNANLTGDAASTKVTIVDGTGAPVRTIDMGARAKGTVPVPWDGRNDSGKLLPPGNYTVQVEATDASGATVEVNNEVHGRVVGVSFEKGYPEVILDSGARAPISDLVAVRGSVSQASSPLSSLGLSGVNAMLQGLAAQTTTPKL